MPTEPSLLLRMHAGDHAAAAALWEALAPRLRAFAGAMLRGTPDGGAAADVVQGAFLRVLELDRAAAACVRDPAAYLTASVRSAVLNLRRESGRRLQREDRAARRRAPGTPTKDDDEIAAAIDALDEQLREVLLLKHVAGLTFDQMADAIGAPRTTLASRHAAALQQLRALLTPSAAPPTGARR